MASLLVMAKFHGRATCAALLLAVLPASAFGLVTGVTTVPAVERVAVGRATVLAITWKVATNSAGSVVVASGGGQFRSPSGTVLGGTIQSLDKTITGPGTASIPEIVSVPIDIIERARRDGHDHILYRRTFTDGGAASGEIKLLIGAQQSAAFGITRVALEFGDGETITVIGTGKPLKARAQVSYTGTGMLRGTWEIAGPNPDADKPAWRVLAEVTRVFTGGETATIVSPDLPTTDASFYLVRFNIAEPKATLEPPMVRYAVRQE